MKKLTIDETYCKGCGLCVNACPKGLLSLCEEINRLGFTPAEISPENLEACVSCALCAQVCPDVAIRVAREVKEK